jgi:hypothetical protein
MNQTNPRSARLQQLYDRWLKEPLGVTFPALGVETASEPENCDQFSKSWRLTSAFAILNPDDPDTTDDRAVNKNHFGVEDPAAVMAELTAQFEIAATNGHVKPQVLKDAAVILGVYCDDRKELAKHHSPGQSSSDELQYASNVAEGQAAAKAQALVAELSTEVGVPLPIGKGRRRG